MSIQGITGTDGTFIAMYSREIVSGVYMSNSGKVFASTKATLKTLPAAARFDGLEALVLADNSRWVFRSASALVDVTDNLVLSPSAGSGAWLRADKAISMAFAIAFGTADAAALFTMPASGFRLRADQVYWEITTSFAGGTNSAIGVSASIAPHSTKGDLLGGSGGDVAAAITSTIGVTQGTIGVSYSAAPKIVVLEPTAVVRYDRIVDVYTSGAGFVHIDGVLIP